MEEMGKKSEFPVQCIICPHYAKRYRHFVTRIWRRDRASISLPRRSSVSLLSVGSGTRPSICISIRQLGTLSYPRPRRDDGRKWSVIASCASRNGLTTSRQFYRPSREHYLAALRLNSGLHVVAGGSGPSVRAVGSCRQAVSPMKVQRSACGWFSPWCFRATDAPDRST